MAKNDGIVARSDPHPFLLMGEDFFKSSKIELPSTTILFLKEKENPGYSGTLIGQTGFFLL